MLTAITTGTTMLALAVLTWSPTRRRRADRRRTPATEPGPRRHVRRQQLSPSAFGDAGVHHQLAETQCRRRRGPPPASRSQPGRSSITSIGRASPSRFAQPEQRDGDEHRRDRFRTCARRGTSPICRADRDRSRDGSDPQRGGDRRTRSATPASRRCATGRSAAIALDHLLAIVGQLGRLVAEQPGESRRSSPAGASERDRERPSRPSSTKPTRWPVACSMRPMPDQVRRRADRREQTADRGRVGHDQHRTPRRGGAAALPLAAHRQQSTACEIGSIIGRHRHVAHPCRERRGGETGGRRRRASVAADRASDSTP